MRRLLAVSLLTLLASPAAAFAADASATETPTGTDYTIKIMFGLIFVLIAGMIVVGILEQRKPH